MISDKEVEHYRQTGYLVVPDVLDADILARLRGALDDSGGRCRVGDQPHRCL